MPASQDSKRASYSKKVPKPMIRPNLLMIVAPLAFGLSACGYATHAHRQPEGGLIVRTTPPPPRVSDYFVVTTGAAHVDVSYPAGSVHYAPNLADRVSD